MNNTNNYPISLTRMAKREGINEDNLLYFLGEEMGYIWGYREILEEGHKHGVRYRYRYDDDGNIIEGTRYVTYGIEVQKLVREKAQYIRGLNPDKVKKYVENDKIVALVYYGVLI